MVKAGLAGATAVGETATAGSPVFPRTGEDEHLQDRDCTSKIKRGCRISSPFFFMVTGRPNHALDIAPDIMVEMTTCARSSVG
jgi:hypothetical protein